MTRRGAVTMFGLSLLGTPPAFGDEYVKPQPEVTRTERVDFSPGGVIRLDGAYGDLYVEGWDQPEVEINVTKSMRYKYDSAQSQEAARHTESIRVVTERRSPTELTISTKLPSRRHGSPPLPRTTKGGVMLEYHILAPRNSQLVIHQGVGNVLVRGVTGDIEATCRMGDIALWLSGTRTYSIDARSRAGTVSSDFSGVTLSHFLFGQTFTSLNPGPSQRLHLRVGFGGITIKPILPESETPPSPASAK
jgi:hypothetical protein